jgi:hypothetical protein
MKVYLIIFLLLGSVFTSCKKEGCTDSNAINYAADAKKDNGTCTYSGSTVFWLNSATGVFLLSSGVTYLEVYVDGSLVGGMSTSSSFGSAPACNSGGVTFTSELGTSTSKTISYEVKNSTFAPNGPVIYSGSTVIQGGQCGSFQIQ